MFQELPDSLLNPKEDKPIAYDWTQSEIYPGEQYLIFENGIIVLDKKENVMEFIDNHYDEILEMLNPKKVS